MKNVRPEKTPMEANSILENLVSSSLDGILAFDRELRYTIWNPGMERISGMRKEDVLGKAATDVFPSLKETGELKFYEDALKGKTTVSEDCLYIVPETGKQGYFFGRYSPMIGSAGNVTGGLAVIHDITERKHVEHTLKKQEKEFRDVFDCSNEIIILHDFEGRILRANKKTLDLLGVSHGEIITRSMRDFRLEDDRKPCHEILEELKQNGFARFTVQLKCSGDRIIIADFNSRVIDSERGRVVASGRDITAEMESHDALRRSEERFRTLVDGASQFIFNLDKKGRLLLVNKSAAALLGSTPEKLLGKKVMEIFPKALAEQYQASIDRVFATGAPVYALSCIPGKNGEHWIDTVLQPLLVNEGLITSVLGISVDVTERHLAQEALKEQKQKTEQVNRRLTYAIRESQAMAEKAEAANVAKSLFLANVSHEIRTPLNGLMGMLGLLEETNLDAEQREIYEIASESGNALLSVINDILDYSRMEKGKFSLVDIEFELPGILNSAVQMFKWKAADKGLKLYVNMKEDVPRRLRGDPGRLRQVFINLLSNAIKFTREGEISIQVILEQEFQDHAFINFSVIDTGIGISRDNHEKIFQSFYQSDMSTTRQYEGTGLGLAISKQIVQMMGGEIKLDSEPGRGSSFWFSIGLKKAQSSVIIQNEASGTSPLAPGNSQERDCGEKCRILVAEDNLTNQLVLKRLLETLGCEVFLVANGREALRAWKEREYSLVLMDVQMPEMDGMEAAKNIRKLEIRSSMQKSGGQDLGGFRHTPIIALTAHTMENDRLTCLASGMDDFMTKPLDLARLREVLQEYAGRKDLPVSDFIQPENAAGAVASFDLDRITLLSSGHSDFSARLIATYLKNGTDALAVMRDALTREDFTLLTSSATEFQGATADMGAVSLAEKCDQLTGYSVKQEAHAARMLLDEIHSDFSTVQNYLYAYLISMQNDESSQTSIRITKP